MKFIGPHDHVLNVGGVTELFPLSNPVIAILPYISRSSKNLESIEEQFAMSDLYDGDSCFPRIWKNIEDDELDFEICLNVLK